MDPTWLVDLIFLLAIINLLMELINTIIIGCSRYRLKIIDILFGKKKGFENKNLF